jgi:hypothetical protein
MRTRIEAVLNNNDAKAQDYFELVNIYEYSQVTLHRDGNSILSMDINEVNTWSNNVTRNSMDKAFDFREKCKSTRLTIEEKDIVSVTGRMLDGMDTFLIEADLKDDSKLTVVIYHVDTNEKREVSESYYESDVFSLMDYLNEEDHKVMMAIIHDSFGLEIKMNSVRNCTLTETEEAFEMLIDTMTFPLMDDSCNGIYIKEGNITDTILIRPYGQPFLEISILVSKENSK